MPARTAKPLRPPIPAPPAAPITYKPFGDGSVVIDGADPVSGFSASGNGVYQTSQDTWDLGEGNNQVFVTPTGGTPSMLFEARWPNTLSLDPSNPVFAHAARSSSPTRSASGTTTSPPSTDPSLTQPAGLLGRRPDPHHARAGLGPAGRPSDFHARRDSSPTNTSR